MKKLLPVQVRGTVELGILDHVRVEMIRPKVNACITRKIL
jgi:hypothetical protein